METSEFRKRLRELRKRAGLTQRELANKGGINFTYLSKIESGAMPPPSKKILFRLADALNIDREELLILAGKIPSKTFWVVPAQSLATPLLVTV